MAHTLPYSTTHHAKIRSLKRFTAFCHQWLILCQVQQLSHQGLAGSLALYTLICHAFSVEHQCAILVIDALCTLTQCLCHLTGRQHTHGLRSDTPSMRILWNQRNAFLQLYCPQRHQPPLVLPAPGGMRAAPASSSKASYHMACFMDQMVTPHRRGCLERHQYHVAGRIHRQLPAATWTPACISAPKLCHSKRAKGFLNIIQPTLPARARLSPYSLPKPRSLYAACLQSRTPGKPHDPTESTSRFHIASFFTSLLS